MIFLRTFAILLIPFLVACKHTAPAQKDTYDAPTHTTHNLTQADHTSELLAFYEIFSDASAESQKNLFNELNKPTTDNQLNQLRQIKLAMVLGLPSSRIRDTAKAQTVLQELIQTNSLTLPDNSLVNLLYEFTADTNKLIKNKGDNKSQQQRVDALQLKNDQLQQKLDALQQKLDALKKIEKTMGDRDAAVPTKP